MGCEGKESERRLEEESCRVCAVGCFSVLPCPALVVVCANLPTCRIFDLLGSRRLGELAGCGGYRAGRLGRDRSTRG